ncbi:MAG: glycosyltransferase N-terminal domain-containing protein [Thermodesulfobacteriota bacterium]|nr:glycosyltransferase N-terminal domain-containing protein [Thermodesulfobacteriota bacterium]
MNLAYTAYSFISSSLFFSLFPPFWFYSRISGRYSQSINQRIGLYPDRLVRAIFGSPRIWMHAVSVGEVTSAIAIIKSIKALMPNCAIILSTTTEHGQAFAENKLNAGNRRPMATCIYAPVDFILSARKALSILKPDVLVCLETEIWPNWLVEAHRVGIKTALVNGRISVRTIKSYLKIRPLMKAALNLVDAFSMINKADAHRIEMIGAPGERIEINGNAKYDLLLNQCDARIKAKMESIYNIKGDKPVFVAGSTRRSEGKIILDVYGRIIKSLPETLLILAPRHVERAPYIKKLVKKQGFACQLRSDLDKQNCLRTAPIVIVDTIGELLNTYSIASIVFCGGSLAPLGGQNILEAAVWGKPVFYGPSMDDFLDAKNLLDKTGGGIQVKDGQELAEKAIYYLANPHKAVAIGKLAAQAMMSHKGAAGKHADVIYRLLNQGHNHQAKRL